MSRYIPKSPFTLPILLILLLISTAGMAQEITIGTYRFKDGSEYQGELFRGKPYGKGKTIFRNGDTYEGEYVKGKRQGYGTYTFADGERYEGEWYQDQQHGTGTFYFKNNNRYEGLWFRDFVDFNECLEVLLRDPALADALGESGRAFTLAEYSPDAVRRRFLETLAR